VKEGLQPLTKGKNEGLFSGAYKNNKGTSSKAQGSRYKVQGTRKTVACYRFPVTSNRGKPTHSSPFIFLQIQQDGILCQKVGIKINLIKMSARHKLTDSNQNLG